MDETTPHDAAISAIYAFESDLLAQVVDHVRAVYPTYAAVSDELLARSLRQNIEMCVRAVSDPAIPDDSRLRSYAQIARRRFEAGVPIDDLIRSYRFSLGLIADKLTELFAEHRVSALDSLHAYRRIWNVSDAYTAVLVEVYRQHRLQLDTRNHEIKMDFIERLRSGRPDEATLDTARRRFHLNPDVPYHAFIARIVSGSEHDLYALMVLLESHLIGRRGIGVIRADTIVGVCARAFDIDSPVSISYGQALPLQEIAESFVMAQHVAATSIAGSSGNHYIADAGWRVSVEPNAPVIAHFEKRFRTPLEATSVDVATILESVREYLEQNRSFRAAAVMLHCHPNTLRYRIARFEEITGARVDDTETILSLQWMFEAHARAEASPLYFRTRTEE